MKNQKHYYAVAGLVVIGSFVTYTVLRAIYQLPKAASAEADTIDVMFNVYFGLIAFWFALIMVFMLYSVIVFRRKPGDTEDAAHIHGHTGLEITWTVIPIFLVIGLGVWGTATFNDLISPNANEMVVKVTGKQWSWGFEYPGYGNLTTDTLVLPVDQPVVLEMESVDVLHSFWVPEFRVKQDLVPGRVTTLRFEPTKIGAYKLRCAEICGLDHTNMSADVTILGQNDFAAWVETFSEAPVYADLSPEERGALWYSPDQGFGCAGCHSLDGTRRAGPTFLGLFGRQESLQDGSTVTVDEAYIRQSILDPNAQIVADFQANIMSSQDFGVLFAEKENEILAQQGVEIVIIEDLIAFIKSLR